MVISMIPVAGLYATALGVYFVVGASPTFTVNVLVVVLPTET